MSTSEFAPSWPVEAGKEAGVYFYMQQIEEYLHGSNVRVAGHGEMMMLGGYSYLGLNGHPAINDAVIEAVHRFGTGTHGARLLSGTLSIHEELEEAIARFKQTEAAATFSSGCSANLSTICCLCGRHDTVICDKLDHASIVDGCRLSGATMVRYRHNDMDHLEECLRSRSQRGRTLVIVDAVFSMDGDIANLPVISQLCREHDAILMVDEAHAIGTLGATGHGIEEHFGLPSDSVDVKMGTLSKSIPSSGGYIAGSRDLCDLLMHQARGFIYSGSLAPTSAAAALAAIDLIEQNPGIVERLQKNAAHFSVGLRAAGFTFGAGETAIFPIVCGDDWKAFELAHACHKRGVYVQAIPHPVVPKGTARLRASVTAAHTTQELDFCLNVLSEAALDVDGVLSC